MKILYVSVHQVLEYDEIRIFQDLGHEIFPLGVYFGGEPSEAFRPPLNFGQSLDNMMGDFGRLGGKFKYNAPVHEQVIPREFVSLFDLVIVMHNFDFIEHHWSALSATKVVWRSIGVGTQQFEPRVRALRDRGCHVVRYCPTEQSANGYAGHDAIIRFGKHETEVSRSADTSQIVTFSHYFAARFPLEYEFYSKSVTDIPAVLCGDGNAGLPGSIGVVDFATQNELLSRSAVYFFAGGTFIPYTLNFMEAWLSGIPLVATDCRAIYASEQRMFAEIPELIRTGENGFLVSTPADASQCLRTLLNDPTLAKEIGTAGADAARKLFSFEVVGPQWQQFLEAI